VNDDETYCRQVEAYLCRKNEGHLIRIVGPAFDQVRGWASKGIPLKAVFRGVDRYVDRYYAKGPKRRPVRIEFCEADVLDAFDEWRRAVGVGSSPDVAESSDNARGTARPRESLSAHLERVVARLVARRAEANGAFDATVDEIVRELDAVRAGAKHLRGDRREAMLHQLRELDRRLVDAARAAADADTLERITKEADEQLSPFRQRMPVDAYAKCQQACIDRLLREQAGLPTITFD
jgi:hypothetical protein